MITPSKYRFFQIPEGKQIRYSEQGAIQFPVGTVISKTFAYPIEHDRPHAEVSNYWKQGLNSGKKKVGMVFLTCGMKSKPKPPSLLAGSEVDVSWIHTDGTHTKESLPESPMQISA